MTIDQWSNDLKLPQRAKRTAGRHTHKGGQVLCLMNMYIPPTPRDSV